MSFSSGDQNDSREPAWRKFRDELVEAKLLIPMGLDGLYGRGGVFEQIVDGIDTVICRKGQDVHGGSATRLRFPPVFTREAFEKTEYIASFPNLTGAISSFAGGDKEHQALLADRSAGHSWDGHLSPAGTMLVPAACDPCYGTLPSVLPAAGILFDVYGYCFRNEPAVDPARMQAFRMHEYVVAGTPEQAQDHRDSWITYALEVLSELGLEATDTPANDPFFGRGGKLLAAYQRDGELKIELVVRLYDDLDDGTAVVSVNCHRDFFGTAFGVSTAAGEVAHSACVAFGIERIALALVRSHGFDPASWPPDVKASMGL